MNGQWKDQPESEKWWTTWGVIWRMALLGVALIALMFAATLCVYVAGAPA